MEKTWGFGVDSSRSGSEPLFMERPIKGPKRVGDDREQQLETGSSLHMQGIAEEVERTMQEEDKLMEGVKRDVGGAPKGSVRLRDSYDQAKGFINGENETDESILLSCVKDEETLTSESSDDESDSTAASASTNDSTKCIYSCIKEGKKARKYYFLSNHKSDETEVTDTIIVLRTMFDKDWQQQQFAKKKRKLQRQARMNGGDQPYVSGERGGERSVEIPRCVTTTNHEQQEPSTPQQTNNDDDGDNEDDFY